MAVRATPATGARYVFLTTAVTNYAQIDFFLDNPADQLRAFVADFYARNADNYPGAAKTFYEAYVEGGSNALNQAVAGLSPESADVAAMADHAHGWFRGRRYY